MDKKKCLKISPLTKNEQKKLKGGYRILDSKDFTTDALFNSNCSTEDSAIIANGNCGCAKCGSSGGSETFKPEKPTDPTI